MEPLQIALLVGVVTAVLWSVTLGRSRIAPYFMRRDPKLDQESHEIWMGGATDGYVPPPDFGPSPRDRLRSADEDEIG
jgi:hypothetical protein